MSGPVNVNIPCDGDAFAPHGWPLELMSCDVCQCYHQNVGKCLGPEGFVLLAHAGAEVARERGLQVRRLEGKVRSKEGEVDMFARLAEERQTGPSATGGIVTKVTFFPSGPDPRLVRDDWGWEE